MEDLGEPKKFAPPHQGISTTKTFWGETFNLPSSGGAPVLVSHGIINGATPQSGQAVP